MCIFLHVEYIHPDMFTKLNKLKQYVPASKVGRWMMSFIPGFILAIPLDIFYMAIARPYISQGSSNPFPTTDLWLKGVLPSVFLALASVTYISLLLKRWEKGVFSSKSAKYFCILMTPLLWLPVILFLLATIFPRL
jgi:hypothetical protein